MRKFVYFARRAELHDLALIHDRDVVRHGHRLILVMGDEYEGRSDLALDTRQFLLHIRPQASIQRRHGLIQQQHGRLQHQAARQRDALALAARQLVRTAGAQALEAHQLEHPLEKPLTLGARRPARLEAIDDVVGDAQMREQRIALEHHVDRAPKAGTFAISAPAIDNVPASGSCSPAINCSKVVLPDPDRPRSDTMEPRGISRLIPDRTRVAPKDFESS